MSTYSPVRTTASGRKVHGNYNAKSYLDPVGENTAEGVEWRLEQLGRAATEMKFKSILDAALTLVESETAVIREQLTEFANGGGLARFIAAVCRKDVKTSIESKDSLREVDSAICAAARTVYLEEWGALTDDKQHQQLRMPLNHFTSEHVDSFNVASLYSGMRSNAPRLFALFEGMGNECGRVDSEGLDYSAFKHDAEHRRRCRHIVMAISVMASLRSRQINVLQGIMSYFMYANRVPKRVITVLHQWGVAVGYTSVLTAVKSMGRSLREKLRSLGKQGIAFEVIFDNCTAAATVRDERLHNKSDFLNYTVGLVLEPAIPRPMFLRADINYGEVASLTVVDFLPSDDDAKTLSSIFGHFIANALGKYCRKRQARLPKLDFPMPIVQRIDPKAQPKTHVLPTYDLDESRIDDMIEILYRIAEDVGLTDAQIEKNTVAYGGDYFTTVAERRAKARQVECSPEKRLNYIEATVGLFHLEVAVLVMLFRGHGGSDKEHGTLSHWIKHLKRNKNTLWDGQKQLIKDFRACFDLFGHIVDGYLVGFVAERCGWTNGGLGKAFEDTIDIQDTIAELAARLADFKQVETHRQSAIAARDRLHENMILFLQQGLILRNFHNAMAHGDIGRLLISFRHLTLWFQASTQYNYAQETIHLTACLQRIWSPEFREFMLQHCLISIMGKPDGFYACDELNEYVVREVKKMMVHNASPKTDEHLRETISPQVMFSMRLKMKVAEESDATYIFDYHHQEVDTSAEVEAVALDSLRRKVFKHIPGRSDSIKKEVPDLLMAGLKELCTTERLTNYKRRVAAMGIRGVVELQRKSRNGVEEEGEEQDEDDIQIEKESLIGGMEDDEDAWLD